MSNDTTVLITADQLKSTNLIFVEHEALIKTNALLNKQIENYKISNDLLVKSDSIRKKELEEYRLYMDLFKAKVDKEMKRKDRMLLSWKIGGITLSSGLLLWLLLK